MQKLILALFILALPHFSLAQASKTTSNNTPSNSATQNSTKTNSDEAPCDVDMSISSEEWNAYSHFNSVLKNRLTGVYGQDRFQAVLNDALEETFDDRRVIDVSPTFMEKLLNLVEQHKLIHFIYTTVGPTNPDWQKFALVMKNVLQEERVVTKPLLLVFRKNSQDLLTAIHGWKSWKLSQKKLSDIEKGTLLARTSVAVTNMNLQIERWNILNAEIKKLRRDALMKRILLSAITIGAGSIVLATTVYAIPLIAVSGTFAASFATDAVVASQLLRMGQVLGGVGMGSVGAPASVLLVDANNTLQEAKMNAQNNNTVLSCEIDKKMTEWKNRGVSPYLSASLVGGAVGLVGGTITLSKAGAKAVLWATRTGVNAAAFFSVVKLGSATIYSVSEYNQAKAEFEKGNEREALAHLYKSRNYAVEAKNAALEAILVGVLAHAVNKEYHEAWNTGDAAIRVLFASSSDTLPTAVNQVIDAAEKAKEALTK